MRAKYCCDAKAYEKYYLSQVGHGMPYFSGTAYQLWVRTWKYLFAPLQKQ